MFVAILSLKGGTIYRGNIVKYLQGSQMQHDNFPQEKYTCVYESLLWWLKKIFWLYLFCCSIHCGASWHPTFHPQERTKYNCAALRNPSRELTCASPFFVVTYFLSLVSNLEVTCMEKGESGLLAATLLPW